LLTPREDKTENPTKKRDQLLGKKTCRGVEKSEGLETWKKIVKSKTTR